MTKPQDDSVHEHSAERQDESAAVGVAGAAGRDHYVGGRIGTAEAAARARVPTAYNGELYRGLDPQFVPTYADHSHGNPGRYNRPGQSTVYTTPTMNDLQAESKNYYGLNGQAVVRSHFEGDLLDARHLPGVGDGALTGVTGAKAL